MNGMKIIKNKGMFIPKSHGMELQNKEDSPCRVDKFFEHEKQRRKGTHQEGEIIIGSIYCDCPKCLRYRC